MGSEAPDLARLGGITKEFAGFRALDGVSFAVRRGEIHALVGENGAGKSTLIKILAGLWPHGSFAGRIEMDAAERRFRSAHDASAAGIAVIHQELALVPEMSVAENICLGEEPRRFGLIDRAALLERAARTLRELGAELDPSRKVAELGTGARQLVEIAKALTRDFRLLILDEPTASLSTVETRTLASILKQLKNRGIGIVYISHRLAEVLELADRITVLRDGRSVGTVEADRADERELIRLMIGREIKQAFPPRGIFAGGEARLHGGQALRVENLVLSPRAAPINFAVQSGEVLGFAGLLGSGRTKLLETLFGLRPAPSDARIFVAGRPVKITSPARAIREGIALVSEDRKETGLVLGASIRTNLTLVALETLCRLGVIQAARERTAAASASERFGIRAPSLEAEAGGLSGGNQQKVAIAKWLMRTPKVLLLDEPTKGIDVGSKEEIYALVRRMASEGLAVVLVSSELIEVQNLCDRILTLSEASVTGEFQGGSADQEALMTAMTQSFGTRS